ncbi:hypothetical protein QWZ04_12675 [Vibrio tapetis subsp. quintayensis]|uniref:hypothetical protein n=1 Tax=Vibrio tapetis TaxID=52443 RepID=UPI0025B3697E|nr:hypothetical protein [Vibrio tapetis]MDN3681177.1 hypothetical protein [Vibrio tapetis subsp. quintayensis]
MAKLYIAALLMALGISFLMLLSHFPAQTHIGGPISATVQDRILTQSLDGQRHYLLLSLDEEVNTVIRIAVGKSNLCRTGDKATVQPITTLLSKELSYQLITCL